MGTLAPPLLFQLQLCFENRIYRRHDVFKSQNLEIPILLAVQHQDIVKQSSPFYVIQCALHT